MSDKYDLDYFDSSEYRRRQPQRRRNAYNRTAYDKKVYRSGRSAPSRRPSNYRRPTRRPSKSNYYKRLKNRIIIVSVGILILIALIAIIVSTFNACAKISNSDNASASTAASTVPTTEVTEPTMDPTDPLNPSYFIAPQIKDDGTNGYTNYSVYIWNKAAYELFGDIDGKAKTYADSINSYKKALGDDISVYNMVIPNHTEMELPERIKKDGFSDSQAKNIKDIYSFLDKSVTPINAYNKISQHNNEYIYFDSDHHWTGLGAYYAYTAFAETTEQPVLDLKTCAENKIAGFNGSFSSTNEGILNVDTVSYYTFPYNVTMDITDESGTTNTYGSPYYEYAEAGPNTYGVFILGDNPLTVLKSESEVGKGKKIAVVKESYGNAFVPYLTYNYEEVHVIDFRYFGSNLKTYCTENGIDEVLYMNGVMSASTQIQLDSMDSLLAY